MERASERRTASALFAGFRALGLFSNDIPHVVRFSALKRRFYVTTCVGKSFHTYDVQKLSLVAVKEYLQLTFDKSVFKISAILHPSTYLNKILLGSEQGSLQLWNVKSNKLLYTFPGWKVGVTALQQAPAVDVVAIGLMSGQVIIHNIKFNETLMKFRQDWGPITSISFRTGQDGTLQSFSTVHEKFNKSLGHEEARESDWDGIIACHQGKLSCSTWNYQKSTIGAYFLKPKEMKKDDITATAVDITSCGNFAVVGLSSGTVDVYNMQSGIHRGSFGKDQAHKGSVRGVAVDGLNQLTVTTGSEGLLKFWNFKNKILIHSVSLSSSPNIMLLHRDSLIDCFLLDSAPLNVSMSPTGDFLATSHVDHLGIYLWSNISLYSVVSLRPLPADYVPSVVMLPGTCQTQDVEESEETVEPSDEMIEYDSPEQLNEQLVTLSLLPESRWKNLLNLDVIKKKNKPKEPPKVPKSAPFFIPTIPGLVPRYAAPEQNNDPQQSKVVNLGVLAQKSDFCLKLEEGLVNNKYDTALNLLKESGPSGIETELRSLSPDCGGSVEVMQSFLKMIGMMLDRKRDFELAQAYLALFLKSQADYRSSRHQTSKNLLKQEIKEAWERTHNSVSPPAMTSKLACSS
ncbi:hypothetical protein H8958_004934 [Nasalis larvatus]